MGGRGFENKWDKSSGDRFRPPACPKLYRLLHPFLGQDLGALYWHCEEFGENFNITAILMIQFSRFGKMILRQSLENTMQNLCKWEFFNVKLGKNKTFDIGNGADFLLLIDWRVSNLSYKVSVENLLSRITQSSHINSHLGQDGTYNCLYRFN